jgi:AraC-like DNA-binding protein
MSAFNESKLNINGNEVLLYWAKTVSGENEGLLTSYTKHTFYELQFPIDGKLVMNAGNKNDFVVSVNDFIVIPPDTYHQIIDADSNGKRFIMAFSFAKNTNVVNKFNDITNKLIVTKKSNELKKLLDTAILFSSKNSVISNEIYLNIISAVLLELIRNVLGEFITNASNDVYYDNFITNEIYNYIKDKRGIDVTLKSLAKTFGYSERHLNRLFNANVGKTVYDVIAREKLSRIEELVTVTDLSLNEIATLTGFCDGYSMNKFFKRYAKTNLSKYRKISRKS